MSLVYVFVDAQQIYMRYQDFPPFLSVATALYNILLWQVVGSIPDGVIGIFH
jgi:hypothetical protein